MLAFSIRISVFDYNVTQCEGAGTLQHILADGMKTGLNKG
jgi:hypothetical protein